MSEEYKIQLSIVFSGVAADRSVIAASLNKANGIIPEETQCVFFGGEIAVFNIQVDPQAIKKLHNEVSDVDTIMRNIIENLIKDDIRPIMKDGVRLAYHGASMDRDELQAAGLAMRAKIFHDTFIVIQPVRTPTSS